MTIKELRSKRVAAEIPATLLATKAKVNRSRLSSIERGYVQPTQGELQRLHDSLEELISAKAVIQQAAASVGWPVPGISCAIGRGAGVAKESLE
jgi:predicted transcriptional regulator